jgi:hypothetical protein
MVESLQKVIKPKYHEMFNDWWEFASQPEREGLDVIEYVFDTKGQEKYAGQFANPNEINILRGSQFE